MTLLKPLYATVAAHPLAMAALAFLAGGILSSTHIVGALLGLLIHALNLAWIVVGGVALVATVWLVCLSFERGETRSS